MPTEHHDEHGLEKPQPHPSPKTDAEHPGYEVSDINTKGIVVFLGGLVAFLVVFFVFCYAAGKALNYGLLKQDASEASTNPETTSAGTGPIALKRGDSMSNNPEMEQREASETAQKFPTPRLEADDSNGSTADMHAREDLLLENYSVVEPGQGPAGTVRIPIEVAMQLVVKQGLPANNGSGSTAAAAGSLQLAKMTGDVDHIAKAPLTNGFARTAFELDQMELRDQKMEAERAQADQGKGQHAKLERAK